MNEAAMIIEIISNIIVTCIAINILVTVLKKGK